MRDADSYELTLQLFDFQVPCLMQLMEPPCLEQASWIAHYRHVDHAGGGPDRKCGIHPMPLCHTHKKLLQATHSGGFWSFWMGTTATTPCSVCGGQLRLDHIDPIKPKG